jgi:hypothetical protein
MKKEDSPELHQVALRVGELGHELIQELNEVASLLLHVHASDQLKLK